MISRSPFDIDPLFCRFADVFAEFALVYQKCPFDPCDTLQDFIIKYSLRTDEYEPFDWYEHRYQVGPYTDNHPDKVLMWGAQLGKSLFQITSAVRYGIEFWGKAIGLYFPAYDLPDKFSEHRFRPLVEQHPEFKRWLGKKEIDDKSDNSKRVRSFGPSRFEFLSTAGILATEGTPFKVVMFDEVRRMTPSDIQRAEKRLSHQIDPINYKASTPRYPDSDIHRYFKQSDQRFFHSTCKCSDGVVLTEVFPDCIGTFENISPALRDKIVRIHEQAGRPIDFGIDGQPSKYPPAFYRCPRCDEILPAPGREGQWIARDPSKWLHGYQANQMLSPTYPAGRMLDDFMKAEELLEFWNSNLGLPYLDKRNMIVQDEHLEACENKDLEWQRTGVNCAMGVDSMGGYNVVVIKEISPEGKYRTIWLDVIIADDPWAPLDDFMRRYDISVAVVDGNPNFNEALRFAKRWEARVWVAAYSDGEDGEKVIWKDRDRWDSSELRIEKEERFKYQVRINRYKGFEWSLEKWPNRECETPSRHGPIMELPVRDNIVVFSPEMKGAPYQPVEVCRQVYWDHLKRMVKAKVWKGGEEKGKRMGTYRMVFEEIGLDPHFAHADLYANVALIRIPKRSRRSRVYAV